jgi:hypothetical protein
MRLAARQGTRITAQEWQMRSEFLAKRHRFRLSLKTAFARL